VLQAAVVFAGTHWLLLSVRGFAIVNVLLTLVWLVIALAILRQHKELVQATRAAA
jgi:hypothetical protein